MAIKSLLIPIVCVLLNGLVFYLSKRYQNLSSYVFIIVQMAIFVFVIIGDHLSFKYQKSRNVEADALVDKLISGDLSNTQREMEDGILEGKLAKYLSSIRKVISEIYGVARIAGNTGIYLTKDINSISQATENIATAVNYMAQGNSEVANSVVKASNNMTKIYQFALEIKEQITLIQENSQNTRHTVDEGNQALKIQSITSLETIESFKQFESVISQLKNMAHEINLIVDTISNISSQINLLALNAAIEAARAGEAGRGFTVVASEVKKLAEDSNASATKVRSLIQKVNSSVDSSIEVINSNKENVINQEKHLKNTESAFANISASMSVVEEEVLNIYTKINDLTVFTESVNSDIESISAVSQESAASAEEINATMQDNANSMGNITERFSELTKKIESISGQLEDYQYIKIAYNEYIESSFQVEVLKEVIKRKLSLAAEGILVNNQEIFRMVAEGKADFTVAPMLPSCRGLEEEYGDRLENLGSNLDGCRLGVVVPSYVTINSLDEIQPYSHKFRNKLYTLQRRTSLGRMAGELAEAYSVSGLMIEYNEEDVLLKALHSAISNQEWIIITSWQPHYMFSIYDLKYLRDPKQVFGKEDHCATLVKKGLSKENPELYDLVKHFKLDMPRVNNALLQISKGASIGEEALRYVNSLKV
ncbi:methyl-accepting chemotaxis protein [Desulfosporosinus sp. PR]|uniref:methyl-accepting chemotaxis protein n=1 Tax=Candidatus Desulfosporosinus nitrosoreducens TaxID=3401928 RepID=UPI0028002BD9|nr:methyl-accepting chemotaxis protein [Desulfosporosinus sp. PR]MDQ7093295.1 methyl-accepting chemotaxis protein [Desulfosporosinus sp. PR]